MNHILRIVFLSAITSFVNWPTENTNRHKAETLIMVSLLFYMITLINVLEEYAEIKIDPSSDIHLFLYFGSLIISWVWTFFIFKDSEQYQKSEEYFKNRSDNQKRLISVLSLVFIFGSIPLAVFTL